MPDIEVKKEPQEDIKKSWESALKNIMGSSRIVEMTFHVPKVDKDKEIISAGAMAKALENYLYLPIISEFHKERPIGIAEKVWQTKGDEFKARARIREDPSVDDVWNKIERGEYNQVSIAGRRLKYSPECNLPHSMRSKEQPCRTTGLRLDSISVCDERARNEGTDLSVVKASSDDPATFVFTTALEITQVKDTLIKAETSNSPLIHPVTDGTKRKSGDSMEKCNKPPVEKADGEEMKEKDEEKKETPGESEEEKKSKEKKGEAGEPEKQEMEKAGEPVLDAIRSLQATVQKLVESDKKVHASVEKAEDQKETDAGKEVKKADPPADPPAPSLDVIKAEMEQDFKKALDAAIEPLQKQITDLNAKLEAFGDETLTKSGPLVYIEQTVDHEGKPIMGNAGALHQATKTAQGAKK
jgi:hypothetical protein